MPRSSGRHWRRGAFGARAKAEWTGIAAKERKEHKKDALVELILPPVLWPIFASFVFFAAIPSTILRVTANATHPADPETSDVS
jgi:hypothetical protein